MMNTEEIIGALLTKLSEFPQITSDVYQSSFLGCLGDIVSHNSLDEWPPRTGTRSPGPARLHHSDIYYPLSVCADDLCLSWRVWLLSEARLGVIYAGRFGWFISASEWALFLSGFSTNYSSWSRIKACWLILFGIIWIWVAVLCRYCLFAGDRGVPSWVSGAAWTKAILEHISRSKSFSTSFLNISTSFSMKEQ
jgi:hypothetical protein